MWDDFVIIIWVVVCVLCVGFLFFLLCCVGGNGLVSVEWVGVRNW